MSKALTISGKICSPRRLVTAGCLLQRYDAIARTRNFVFIPGSGILYHVKRRKVGDELPVSEAELTAGPYRATAAPARIEHG
jgi:hypothetical protein